jgi:hypothetical protein
VPSTRDCEKIVTEFTRSSHVFSEKPLTSIGGRGYYKDARHPYAGGGGKIEDFRI